MEGKEIGKINHWYDKIGVAVIGLQGTLKVGDKIKVQRGEEEFECVVESMEIDHKQVSSAKKGDGVAIKLPNKTKEGAIIILVK